MREWSIEQKHSSVVSHSPHLVDVVDVVDMRISDEDGLGVICEIVAVGRGCWHGQSGSGSGHIGQANEGWVVDRDRFRLGIRGISIGVSTMVCFSEIEV